MVQLNQRSICRDLSCTYIHTSKKKKKLVNYFNMDLEASKKTPRYDYCWCWPPLADSDDRWVDDDTYDDHQPASQGGREGRD